MANEDASSLEKALTMTEFAEVSGLSRPTISKYFHDPDSVRAKTRKRIESAVQQYGYRPNLYAMNHNRKSTNNIGIVVPFLVDPVFAEFARRIERLCIEAGYRPVIYSAHGDRSFEERALESLHSLKPAGALIAPLGTDSDNQLLKQFSDEFPTVFFDSAPGFGGQFVGSDNAQSIGMIVDYLCRTGEPPCYFDMPRINPNAKTRRLAYQKAMEGLGHEPKVIASKKSGWNFEEIGFEEGKRLLELGALPSRTVLCANDRIAIGLLAAAYEQGMRVGSGQGCALRIAGHDDHPGARFTSPSLTTVAQNYDGIAERSVSELFARVESDTPTEEFVQEIKLSGQLVMRASA